MAHDPWAAPGGGHPDEDRVQNELARSALSLRRCVTRLGRPQDITFIDPAYGRVTIISL